MALKQVGKGFNFDGVARKIAAQRTLIKMDAGRMAVNHFKGSFRDQGFIDSTLEPWENVKRRQEGTAAYKSAKKAGRSRAILVDSGFLRSAIKVIGMPGFSVIIGTKGVQYGKIHNEGLKGKAFGKHAYKMPKRQFIGNSKKLEDSINRMITNRIKKAWGQS